MPSFDEIIAALKESSTAYKDKLAKAYASPEAFKQAFMSNLAELAPPDPRDKEATMQFAINRAMDIPGGFAGAIKAYHGSPHKFDAFDMSKIGTGEGAQAYGHGLYFAESPEVAKAYQRNLSDIATPTYKEQQLNDDSMKEIFNKNHLYAPIKRAVDDKVLWAVAGPENLQYSIKEQIKKSIWSKQGQIDRFNRSPNKDKYLQEVDELTKMIDDLKKIDPQDFSLNENGNLYNVSLEWPDAAREAADPLGPQHFLDWGKPLSESIGSIKNALSDEHLYNLGIDSTGKDAYTGKDLSISDFVKFMQNQYGDRGSAKLAEAGIPGIRYLDGGSRGAGEGSYNYVIFDDKIPRIVERNGKGLLGEPK